MISLVSRLPSLKEGGQGSLLTYPVTQLGRKREGNRLYSYSFILYSRLEI